MRILLTGATGFVGSNVSQYFRENTDWEIITEAWNHGESYDVVINLASKSSVEQSISNPQGVIGNNITHTLEMLELARQQPPELFIQFSTVEVNNITNPYAASKKAQESICKAYSETYGVPIVVLRSTNIIGKGQGTDKFVPKIIELIKNNKPITIYTMDGKLGKRVYNPIKNVCDTLKFIISQRENYVSYHEYGVDGGEELNNLEIAQKIAKLLDKDLKATFIDTADVRPSYLMDYVRSDETVHIYQSLQSLDDGLRELL